MVGDIGAKHAETITTIGYVPKRLSSTVKIDDRYDELRITDNEDFSYLEPIRYWTDIISSGIKTEKVKVLGINGGQITSFEYRLALSLGAKVAVIKDSGGEAKKIIIDKDWSEMKNLINLTPDAEKGYDFVMNS
jgi:hypothetical protein